MKISQRVVGWAKSNILIIVGTLVFPAIRILDPYIFRDSFIGQKIDDPIARAGVVGIGLITALFIGVLLLAIIMPVFRRK